MNLQDPYESSNQTKSAFTEADHPVAQIKLTGSHHPFFVYRKPNKIFMVRISLCWKAHCGPVAADRRPQGRQTALGEPQMDTFESSAVASNSGRMKPQSFSSRPLFYMRGSTSFVGRPLLTVVHFLGVVLIHVPSLLIVLPPTLALRNLDLLLSWGREGKGRGGNQQPFTITGTNICLARNSVCYLNKKISTGMSFKLCAGAILFHTLHLSNILLFSKNNVFPVKLWLSQVLLKWALLQLSAASVLILLQREMFFNELIQECY